MPKCTIDGKEIEVAAGVSVLQAALEHRIPLQYFCWHPDLPLDGNCRTSMAEIEKLPKLHIACNTVIPEGMVYHTTSQKPKQAHRPPLHLLLTNTPTSSPPS